MTLKQSWPLYSAGQVVPGTECAVVQKLGQGGQAEVYLVRQTYLEKLNVMKLWSAEALTDESFRGFRAEAIKQGAMAHENIVSVVSGGMTAESPRRPYFLMAYHEGHTLDAVLRKVRAHESLLHDAHLENVAKGKRSDYKPTWISVRSAGELCIQLCAALTHAHVVHGLIHRDLKPANILLENLGFDRSIVKLLDFGIAKLINEALARPDEAFHGSLRYAAPEQLEGKAFPQTDLYAVAGVLYELLTGVPCFPNAKNAPSIVRALLHEMPVPPSARIKGISPRLDALVMQNLSKNPHQRSASARELAKELTAILAEYEAAEAPGNPHAQHDDVTDRMPFQQVMALAQGADEENLMRAKAASYWDSQRGTTMSVADLPLEDRAQAQAAAPAGPQIIHAKPHEAAHISEEDDLGSRATTPFGEPEAVRHAKEAFRAQQQQQRVEGLAAATRVKPKLGDTDPSRVEPYTPAPRGGASPASVPLVSPGAMPMSAMPATDPLSPISHEKAADQWKAHLRNVERVEGDRRASTTPMAGAPGRVPAKVQSTTTPLGPPVRITEKGAAPSSSHAKPAAFAVGAATLVSVVVALLLLVVVAALVWSFHTGQAAKPSVPTPGAAIGIEPTATTAPAPTLARLPEVVSAGPVAPAATTSSAPVVTDAGAKKTTTVAGSGAKKAGAPRGESPNVLP